MQSLIHRSATRIDIAETKQGTPMYDGTSATLHQWEFRTSLRAKAVEEGQEAREASRVIEALRGDALQCAMDVDLDKLTAKDGLKVLIEAMRAMVFPTKRQEAKELYSQGHREGGQLSKQAGESMLSYISRRRRWWKLVNEMDSSIQLSEEIRGDLLLEASGLSKNEKLMVLTSTSNDCSFEKIAVALMEQHGKEVSASRPEQRSSKASSGKGNFSRWHSGKAGFCSRGPST